MVRYVDRATAGPPRTGRVLNVYRVTEKYRDWRIGIAS